MWYEKLTQDIRLAVQKQKLFTDIDSMSDCIILLDPKWFSCLQNKWILTFNMLYDHKLHVINLMTFLLEMFSNQFGSWLDEGPGRCFVLPQSYSCPPFGEANVLAVTATSCSSSSTLMAGDWIDTVAGVAVHCSLNVPSFLSVKGSVCCCVCSVRADMTPAVHAPSESLLASYISHYGWRGKLGSDKHVS